MKLDPMAVCVSFEWRGKEKAGGATTVTVACVVCVDRRLADGGVGANEQSEAEERRKLGSE